MSLPVSVLLYPLLILIAAPLLLFALCTTVAASLALLFRVLLVYADLAAVLIRSQFLQHQTSISALPHALGKASQASGPPSRRRSSGSKSAESTGLGIYSAGSMHRDFEGVGGWRIPNTAGEDILWTSMNARLELPAFSDGHFRHHRRAITSGAASAMTPEQHPRRVFPTTRSSDIWNQEEYFLGRHTSKSTGALGITGSSLSLH
ncbi:MAG: hypothetical protein LQ339_002880 [Xanthoria mediterranea]|nr:MAG: hypothetical protein LQ339_002880 [Xanthoria mediterranea]